MSREILRLKNDPRLHFPKSEKMKIQTFSFKTLESLIPNSFDLKEFFPIVKEASFIVVNSGAELGLFYQMNQKPRRQLTFAVETKAHYSVNWEDVFKVMAKDLNLSFPLSSHTFWENF